MTKEYLNHFFGTGNGKFSDYVWDGKRENMNKFQEGDRVKNVQPIGGVITGQGFVPANSEGVVQRVVQINNMPVMDVQFEGDDRVRSFMGASPIVVKM